MPEESRRPPTPDTLRWVARAVGPDARVTAVTALRGGITADMDRLTVAAPGGVVEVVLRRWADEDWTVGLVAREAAALDAVRGSGVPAPVFLAGDQDGAQTGVRCSLTTVLPGEPDLTPADPARWLDQLATTHAAVHAVPGRPPTTWLGWFDDVPERYGVRARPLAWIADPGLREAARQAADGPRATERVLVHGDYQPFNVLMSQGRLSGVVDWPHAATGARGSDVGHCRLNLAVLFGVGTAVDYLRGYERAAGAGVDRVADLRALLCFDVEWQEFIPRQVAGRARIDVAGMPDRVAATVRAALDGLS